MRFNPSVHSGLLDYGVLGPDGIEEGVYLVSGKYLYQYMYTGDLFLRASPGNDYSALQSAGQMPRISDPAQKASVIALIRSGARKMSGKDEIATTRAKIAAMPAETTTAPVGFTAAPAAAPPPDGGNERKFYAEPWFWAATVGGTALLGYVGYTIFKKRA